LRQAEWAVEKESQNKVSEIKEHAEKESLLS